MGKLRQLIPAKEGRMDSLDHALALLRVELEEEGNEAAAADLVLTLKRLKLQCKAMHRAALQQNHYRFYMLAFQTSRMLLNSFVSHQFKKFAAA